jgi:hypothetical protein
MQPWPTPSKFKRFWCPDVSITPGSIDGNPGASRLSIPIAAKNLTVSGEASLMQVNMR